MSLNLALGAAVAGLHVTQQSLSIVAANVANAGTPGYVRKTPVQVTTTAGDFGIGVRIAAVNRELDQYLQRQLRIENSGGGYADLRAQFYQRLQQIYGAPGSESALSSVFGKLTASLQALAATPESASARYSVLSSAQVLAQHLNGMTADIQGLRSDAELGLADAVRQANIAMANIAKINEQIALSGAQDSTTAVLFDQRDGYLDQLSRLMDIRVVQTDRNQVNVFTNSGYQLVGTSAATLAFDPHGSLTALSQWNADPATRGVGTLVLKSANGDDIDLVANNTFRSGQIAGYLEMRDHILVEAQAQLDQIAAAMASALSDRTTTGSAVTSGAQAGFDVDIGNLLAGNTVKLTYTDTTTNTQRRITIVRVDDPAALPLPASATADPNDKVVGVNFSGGLASVVAQLNAALGGTGLQFSNPSGTSLRALDDGAAGKVDINTMTATATTTSLTGGSAELPFFLDGGTVYSGAISASGVQSLGLAGRIVVNPALAADPTRLVVFQTSPLTASGDPTRPSFLYDRLLQGRLDFAPQAGVGTAASPFSGTLTAYLQPDDQPAGRSGERGRKPAPGPGGGGQLAAATLR